MAYLLTECYDYGITKIWAIPCSEKSKVADYILANINSFISTELVDTYLRGHIQETKKLTDEQADDLSFDDLFYFVKQISSKDILEIIESSSVEDGRPRYQIYNF